MKKLDFEMSKAMGNGYSLTCSTMPDRYMKKTYLCMTMHYIKDSILVNRLLSFSCLEELDCTGSFLEDKIEQILRRDLRDDKPIFVTVADSKLNESSLGLEVVSCISDLLNKTIEQAFSEMEQYLPYAQLDKNLLGGFV
ncbi:uncharacterized protein LOC115561870 [Drosophila navojoa]|uniref:uncharacterized protein LOC115561870 n=1 Tax=Drosophila navojoa TaxID=7232 RepID=UPI0011BEE455|nr:uncharacterized protein LOC115561870 [Drosophila navojoa]